LLAPCPAPKSAKSRPLPVPDRSPPLSALRRNARWVGVGLGFLTLVPLHAAVTVTGRRQIVPPLFLGTMGRIAGLRVRTEGAARPGALLLANHVSWLDILALARTS